MAGAQSRTSCRSLFKHSGILPVPCQYILPLMSFIISDKEIFQTDSSIHYFSTRNKHHLDRPNANLSCFQKSTLCGGINIFNSLPSGLIVLKNDKANLKATLRKSLHTQSFYSVNKCFMCRKIYNIFVKYL
jgi:hypothetical protein